MHSISEVISISVYNPWHDFASNCIGTTKLPWDLGCLEWLFFIWVILLQICFCWMGPIIGVMVMLISWSILWYSRGRLSIYDCLQNVPITERNTIVLMYAICNLENVYGTERQNKPIFLHMTLKKKSCVWRHKSWKSFRLLLHWMEALGKCYAKYVLFFEWTSDKI